MLPLLVAVVVVSVPVAALTFASGTVMPLLTGLVTKASASSRTKAIANLGLSVVAGVLAAFIAHSGTLELPEILTAIGQTYVASAAAYHALWKPTGAADAVANATANVGIGKPDPTSLASDGDAVVDGVPPPSYDDQLQHLADSEWPDGQH